MYQFEMGDIKIFAAAWVARNTVMLLSTNDPTALEMAQQRMERELLRIFNNAAEPIEP